MLGLAYIYIQRSADTKDPRQMTRQQLIDLERMESDIETYRERALAYDRQVSQLRIAVDFLLNYYDEVNPIRTADLHAMDCTCTRCAVDGFRELVK